MICNSAHHRPAYALCTDLELSYADFGDGKTVRNTVARKSWSQVAGVPAPDAFAAVTT